jgi:cytochrome b pre-mRNA-processing protein 3
VVVLQRLFKPSAHRIAGQSLYEAATRQARQTAFYAELAVPDTVEGRFELYTLHVVLLVHRLTKLDGEAARVSQALFDAYLQALDDALREMGVGDLSVAKKMRKLGEAFYGRAKAYQAILAAPGMEGLAALIERTIYAGVDRPSTDRLVSYVQRSAAALAATPVDDVLAARLNWPEIDA